MREWDAAQTKVKQATAASGAGGNTTISFTVPAGCMWEVLFGIAYHDDAARACTWYIVDHLSASVLLGAGRSCAANVPCYLYSGWDGTVTFANTIKSPLRLAAAGGITMVAAAMAGAKTITGALVVREIKGAEATV
jgi:hypothetical protein